VFIVYFVTVRKLLDTPSYTLFVPSSAFRSISN